MSFVYDMSDQPTVVSGTATGTGAANGNYRYDGNLKRVRSQVNGKAIYNVFDTSGGLVTVKEVLAGPDKVTDYVSGPAGSLARLIDGVPTYVHTDHLGSPRATTSTVGAVTAEAIYSPFGLEVSHTMPDNQGGFTGHIRDSATGLNYMQARYYDPVMGRFLSVDPLKYIDTGVTAMFNRYSYTNGDPINLIDPNGMASWRMRQAQYNREKREERKQKSLLSKVLEALGPNIPTESSGVFLTYSVDENGVHTLTATPVENMSENTTETIYQGTQPLLLALGGGTSRTAGASTGIRAVSGTSNMSRGQVVAAGVLNQNGGLTLSRTVGAQLSGQRSYIPTQSILETIRSGRRVSDPRGVPGRFMYTLPASRNGTAGRKLEVLVNEKSMIIEHVLYK